jgi:hypothetical protein
MYFSEDDVLEAYYAGAEEAMLEKYANETQQAKSLMDKIKSGYGKAVEFVKKHPKSSIGALAAGTLLTGIGAGRGNIPIPGISKITMGDKLKGGLKKLKKNKALLALGLLGAAGGAYALANRNKKRAFDEDDLLEAYYAGLEDGGYGLDKYAFDEDDLLEAYYAGLYDA